MVVLQKFNENLKSICTDSTVIDLLSHQTLQKYISSCVKVCLYMIASDPPVVIIAPGWQRASKVRPSDKDRECVESVTIATGDTETDPALQQAPELECEASERSDVMQDEEQEMFHQTEGNQGQCEIVDPELEMVDLHIESEIRVDGARRDTFNKTLFKEYTQRGMFMKFIVWPYMLLHENGPLLYKGVAQGTDEEIERN